MRSTIHFSTFARLCITSVIALCACGAGAPEFPAVKRYAAERGAELEREIAARLLRRPDVRRDALARLDLEVDLRVLERFLLEQAAKADADTLPAALLRAREMSAAAATLEELLRADDKPRTRSQAEGMLQLHQLSYAGDDLRDAAAYDDFCRRVGLALLNVASPAAVESKSVPAMRPALPQQPTTAEAAQPVDGPRTPAALSEDVRRANVAGPLRQQLLGLLVEQQALAAEPGQAREAARVLAVLSGAVDLMKGVQGKTGMDGPTRERIESALAEGLALYGDARTRPAGLQRIEGLAQYRAVLVRLSKLRLTADQAAAFAGALVWAQANAAAGGRVLSALENFAQASAQYDAVPRAPVSLAAMRPSVEAARKAFEGRRDQFLATANDVTAAGGPAGLETQVDALRRAGELVGLLQEVPAAVEEIDTYKPRPFGAIERRAVQCAMVAAGLPAGAKPPSRAEAVRFLSDLIQIERTSKWLAGRPLDGVPSALVQAYAGTTEAAFEARVRAEVGAAVALIAGGGEADRGRVARLAAGRSLAEALRGAADLEAALDTSGGFARWADWNTSTDDMRAVLAGRRDALADAFAAVAGDSPNGLERWKSAEARYRPLVALIERDAAYGSACDALPTGFKGEVAKLLTPMDGRAFAAERYTSLALWAWARCTHDNDRPGADAAVEALGRGPGRKEREESAATTRPAVGPKPAVRPAAAGGAKEPATIFGP